MKKRQLIHIVAGALALTLISYNTGDYPVNIDELPELQELQYDTYNIDTKDTLQQTHLHDTIKNPNCKGGICTIDGKVNNPQ